MRDHMMGFAPIATFIADQMPDAPKPKKTERARLTPHQEVVRRHTDTIETEKLTLNRDFEIPWKAVFTPTYPINENAHKALARAIGLPPELASEYLGQLLAYKCTKDTSAEFTSDTWTDESGNVSYLIRGEVYEVDTLEGHRFSRWEGEWMGRETKSSMARETEAHARGPVLRVLGAV